MKLLEYSDKYHFKIEEDVVVFEAGANTDDLARRLEEDLGTKPPK